MDPTSLPPGVLQHRGDRPLRPLVGVADDELDAGEPSADQAAQKLRPEGTAPAGPTSTPRTSRSPVAVTPVAITTAVLATRSS
jgi:hypothetical protein